MHGVQYVTDELGEKTAVLIDLKKNGDLWEDFYDVVVAKKRECEPCESLEFVKKRIIGNGKH
jgi:hypothetical protein